MNDFWDEDEALRMNGKDSDWKADHGSARADGSRSVTIRGDLAFAESRECVDEGERPDEHLLNLEEMGLREAMSLCDERTLDTVLHYVYQGGRVDVFAAFKNFLAMTRRACPEFLAAMSQTMVGRILGETKASVSAREIRVVERQLQRWGYQGFHLAGGTKGEETRARCSEAQMGNTNRRDGARRRKKRMKEKKKKKGRGERGGGMRKAGR